MLRVHDFIGLRFFAVGISLASRFYLFENYERFVFYWWRSCPYADTFLGIVARKLFLLATVFLDCCGTAGTDAAMASSLVVLLGQQLSCFAPAAVLHQGFVFLLHASLYICRVRLILPLQAAVEPRRQPPAPAVADTIAWRISSVKKLINFAPKQDFGVE